MDQLICEVGMLKVPACPLPVHNNGCGDKVAHKNCYMVIPEKTALVTRASLRTTGPVPAGSRQ